MDLYKTLVGGIFAGLMTVAANSACAVPLTLSIDTELTGGAFVVGGWELFGPISTDGVWVNDYYTTFDVLPGAYTFGIGGLKFGDGSAVTTWILTIGDETVAGSLSAFLDINVFGDRVDFATTVPEPSTLWLLGMGFVALGLIWRRKKSL